MRTLNTKTGKFSFARLQFLPETADLQCVLVTKYLVTEQSHECWWSERGAGLPVTLTQPGWRAAAAPVPVCAHRACRFSCRLLLFCGCRKLRQRHQKAETAGRVRIVALLGQCHVQGGFCVVFLLMLGVFRQRNLKQPISRAGRDILSLCSEREIRASVTCTRLSYGRKEKLSLTERREKYWRRNSLFSSHSVDQYFV